MSFPFISYSPVAEFVNLGKDANAAVKTAVVAATSHTLTKTTPPSDVGLDSGTEFAEDVPTGPVKEPNWHLYGPAAGSAYSKVFSWRPPTQFKLQKLVLNLCLGMNITANAGNDCSFDSVDVRIRQVMANKSKRPLFQKNYPTGDSVGGFTGTGTRSLIIEDALRYNDIIEGDWLDFKISMNVTAGTATFTTGMFPLFAYDTVNDSKWFSQSGVLLQGTEIVYV